MNAHSGEWLKVFTLKQNRRSRWFRIAVHVPAEWVFTLGQNMHSGTVSGLTRVVRTEINGVFYYTKAGITDAQKLISSGAVAAITLSKEVGSAAKGKLKAVVLEITKSATDDGKLYEYSIENTNVISTHPAPSNTTALQGKIPLVLVHGIQATCTSEKTAYYETWKTFSNFFYTDTNIFNNASAAALRDKYALYSFAYQTDLSIAHNGQMLSDEMLRVFGTTKVIVLAHSMGGLVARYVDANSSDGLAGLITLNTPHHGTKTANDLAPIVSALSKVKYLELLELQTITGIPFLGLSKEGLEKNCFLAGQSTGAKDLNWDNFDNADIFKRCTDTDNPFLCSFPYGVNKKNFTHPSKVYLYSSYLGNDLQWSQFIQILSGSLMSTLNKDAVINDGDVPLSSQQFWDYFDDAPNYRMHADIKTHNYFNLDHVQIHEDYSVFTTGGIKGYGLVGDLLDLAIPTPTPAFTFSLNGLQASFDASTSTPAADIAEYAWNFGDGTIGNGITATHIYASYSNTARIVTLTVVDIYARAATTTHSLNTAPSIPTGVTAIAGDSQATISWTPATGTTYNLYIATVTGVNKTNYASLAGGTKVSGVTSPYTQTGLSNGTPYYFVVTAVNASVESGESNQVTATPQIAQVVTSTLNDTGIIASQCYQAGSNTWVACNSAGALALNSAQDGMLGRDVTINNAADGKLGFSFSAVTGGCVQDNVTGLMWEVKTTDGGLRDKNKIYTNYSSTYNPSGLYGAATDASGFVTAVNASNLCGYNDWRLPTADELQSIVYYGVAYPGPTIDTTWFPNMQGGRLWSSSPVVGISSYAWVVDFVDGYVYGDYRDNSYYVRVRLVRAGQSQPLTRYSVSADGQEVTDNQTKLIWMRCSEGMSWDGTTCAGAAATFTHEAALTQASAQASSTGVAWRLPNIKELTSIADKSLRNTAIDSAAFPATPASSFWSSSPYVGNSDCAWSVLFSAGGVNYGFNRGNSYYVRLVRAGQ